MMNDTLQQMSGKQPKRCNIEKQQKNQLEVNEVTDSKTLLLDKLEAIHRNTEEVLEGYYKELGIAHLNDTKYVEMTQLKLQCRYLEGKSEVITDIRNLIKEVLN